MRIAVAPFPCPPVLEMFWDFLVTNSNAYAQFCKVGLPSCADLLMKLERPRNLRNEEATELLTNAMQDSKALLQPLFGLWTFS